MKGTFLFKHLEASCLPSDSVEPCCDFKYENNFSSPQIRLSEVSGVEVADRRGYLTLELETGKDGVLLLR